MKAYVEFYIESATTPGKMIPACGDRATVILDNRRSLENLVSDAHSCNGVHRPWYPAFKILRGEFLLAAEPVTELIRT